MTKRFRILRRKFPFMSRGHFASFLKLEDAFAWIKPTGLLWQFPTDLCPISWAMVTPRSKPVSWVMTQLQKEEQTPPNCVTPRSFLFPSGNSRSNLKWDIERGKNKEPPQLKKSGLDIQLNLFELSLSGFASYLTFLLTWVPTAQILWWFKI